MSAPAQQTDEREVLALHQLDTFPPEYPFSRQIEDILEQFNDYEAAILFEAAEIKWPSDGGLAYPSREQIRGVAKRLMVEQALTRDGYRSGSGFFVLKMHDRLGLYFIPVHGETFGEGYPEQVEGDVRAGFFNHDAAAELRQRIEEAFAPVERGLADARTRAAFLEQVGRVVLHQLEHGEASDGDVRDIQWCALALREALGGEGTSPLGDLWNEVRLLREELEHAADVARAVAKGAATSATSQPLDNLRDRIGKLLVASRERVGVGVMYPDPSEGEGAAS